MKWRIIHMIILLVVLPVIQTLAQPQVLMRNCLFRGNDNLPYVETQFSILSASIKPVKQANHLYKASFHINIFYLNHLDDTIHKLDYRLHTGELKSPELINFDLLDIKQVYLPSGKYRVELVVEDINTHQSVVMSERIAVYFPASEVCFSDALFLEKYSPADASSIYVKQGYSMTPYPVNIYPGVKDKLIFYQEIYNSNSVLSDTTFFIQIQLLKRTGEFLEQYTHTYKEKCAPLVPVLTELNIEDLQAGQYILNIQVRKKNTEVVASVNTFFIRTRTVIASNTERYLQMDIKETFVEKLDGDSIFYWLECLSPIASSVEKETIQEISKQNDTLRAKKFLYAFWNHIAPGTEETEWLIYKADVDAAEYSFSTPIRHGFETDRGRVYLQYGKPDRRHVMNNEPGALPYEIWQYYRINSGQTNVMFVFYLPGIATNDYHLIHSDVNGELRDSRWKYKIYASMKEMSGYTNPDNTSIRDHWGKRIDQILNW